MDAVGNENMVTVEAITVTATVHDQHDRNLYSNRCALITAETKWYL